MGVPISKSGHALEDFLFEVSKGNVVGHSIVNKFGINDDVDAAETIWSHGGVWVPPTTPRKHNIAANAADVGTLVSSGTATSLSTGKLIDSEATFVTDSVAVGDVVLNDTRTSHNYVVSVDSEIQLTLGSYDDFKDFNVGNAYRVVTNGSTGASVVLIDRGLDDSWALASEYVILNGASAVATANTYARIHRMKTVLDAGSGNTGEITATAQTDATVTAAIPATLGQTSMAIYTVPVGHSAFLLSQDYTVNKTAATSGVAADVSLRAKAYADAPYSPWNVKYQIGLSSIGSSNIRRMYSGFTKFTEKTDIIGYVDSVSNANTSISCEFDLLVVDNNYL